MAAFLQRMREQGLSCDIEQSSDDLRVSLLAVADSQNAELIIVGRGPTSKPGLLHLGSELEFLAHHADRPLAIIGAATLNHSEPRVVVAVDGSELGVAALRWAASYTSRSGHEVIPVTVDGRRRSSNQLVETAETLEADSIVVGARQIDGTLLGSMLGRRVGGLALDVLHETRRSLVLVPCAPGESRH